MLQGERVAGSFRDPSGFIYRADGEILRQVNRSYQAEYDLLTGSGLYDTLAASGLLVSHQEADGAGSPDPGNAYKTIRPERIPFISFPYEWSFSQIRDAALTTLNIQKEALKFGMTLKDCSAYNIQFLRGRPVFIDTLSFERYEEGMPWKPYRQFCQHFLAPLALMALVDVQLGRILRVYIDGIPLNIASAMLPARTRFSPGFAMHIHMHARTQNRYADTAIEQKRFERKMSRVALLGLLDSLEGMVRKLRWKPAGTEWADYYNDDSYTSAGLQHKSEVIAGYLGELSPATAWDLGANTGVHSRLACKAGADTMAFDVDPACVEKNYLEVVKHHEESLLPLTLDLTNPSPSLGWANEERESLVQRGPTDTVMALALIHHLAISNNVPLGRIAEFLKGICRSLIIEFVPKSDHKVQKLLATREDVFPDYEQAAFEKAFERFFRIARKDDIRDSKRTMYMMAAR